MVYMWTVPAKVEGRWNLHIGAGKADDERMELDLVQSFQDLYGRATRDGRSLAVERAFVEGSVVFFRLGMGADALLFAGRSDGARLSGSVTDARGREQRWSATRPAGVPATPRPVARSHRPRA
jgi:hypothetical protein